MHFARNSEEGLRSRKECCQGYISIYEDAPEKLLPLPPKSCHNVTLWLKERCNWSIAVTWLRCWGYMLTLQALEYIQGNDRTAGPFVTMPQEPWHPGRVLNWIVSSNSTVGKCTPMQVIKQLEHGWTSTKVLLLSDKL